MPRSALPTLASLFMFAIFVGIVALDRAVAATNFLRWRFPADIMSRAVRTRLAIPVGDGFKFLTLSARAQSVRFSLRAADPSQVKSHQAIAAAYLEGVWSALCEDAPIKLPHRQATALAGELCSA